MTLPHLDMYKITPLDDNAPYDFSISQDGSKMLIVSVNEQIIEFDLSTDYDITTAVGVETSTIGVGIPTALTIQTSSAMVTGHMFLTPLDLLLNIT